MIREAGGDRSAVTGGTKLLSDRLVIEVTQEPGKSFLDRMIALVEGAERRKTPNEIALNILLAGLTITFVAAVVTLRPFAIYAGTPTSQTVLIALLVALIPTTIGALLSAIGIAGMDRLVQRNVLAMSGRAVEASGDVDVLLLDKTGTITLGNRQAAEFLPGRRRRRARARRGRAARVARRRDAGRPLDRRAREGAVRAARARARRDTTFVPFSATTRMSGVNMNGTPDPQGRGRRSEAVHRGAGRQRPARARPASCRASAEQGGTPLVVARDNWALGVVHLKDIVKGGMNERFDELRRMGIRTVMITGDNRVTAAVIAQEAGVDDFLAEATPETKMALIKEEQAKGRHGRDDRRRHERRARARPGRRRRRDEHRHVRGEGGRQHGRPRLEPDEADRDRRGRQAAADHPRRADDVLDRERRREVLRDPAGDVRVHLRDHSPAQRGPLDALNIMHLGDPKSAIISAIIFNALIIPALVPLALKGVKYRAIGATALLRRNLLIYGLGGMILPFVGIKLIDLIVHNAARGVSAAACGATTGSCSGWRPGWARPTACCRRAGGARRGTRRRDRLPRAARPARDDGARRRARAGAAAARGRTAGSSSRRWTSTRSSGARPSWR